MIITRFAPSPTGEDIHVGNLRVAILNHSYARKHNGMFVLRIEDTANDRLVEACSDRIKKCLTDMNMEPDAVYVQSKKKNKHLEIAYDMMSKGLLYEEDGAIWFEGKNEKYTDETYGEIEGCFNPFVCVRSNGEPSFIFANILDDLELMEQGELVVIRGNDHTLNTLKQVAICKALGVAAPSYRSVSMIHDCNGKPLSKRDKAGTVGKILDMGVSTECLYNYLLSIGNNKSAAQMDLKKLLSLNKKYINKEWFTKYKPEALPFYDELSKHIRCVEDFDMFSYLWETPPYAGDAKFLSLIAQIEKEKPVEEWITKEGLNKRDAYAELRRVLCNTDYSLDLNYVLHTLNIEEVKKRLYKE